MKNGVWYAVISIYGYLQKDIDLAVLVSTIFLVIELIEYILIKKNIYAKYSCIVFERSMILNAKGSPALRGLFLKHIIEKDKIAAEACLLAKEYFDNN